MNLTTFARSVLIGSSATSPVPPYILSELGRHINTFPDDTNFKLSVTDGPFGQVICMEESCYTEINLKGSGKGNAGKARGFGSLKAFEDHINSSPAHRAARNLRVSLMPKSKLSKSKSHSSGLDGNAVASGSGVKRGLSADDDEENKKPRLTPELELELFVTKPAHIIEMEKKINGWRVVFAKFVLQRTLDIHPAFQFAIVTLKRLYQDLYTASLKLGRHSAPDFDVEKEKAQILAGEALNQAAAGDNGAAAPDFDLDGYGAHLPDTEDYQAFFKNAADGADFEGNSTVDAAVKALGLRNQKAIIPGMAITLLPHQFIGVAWMVEQEKSKNFGGILGDSMGLGKTVQTLGLMACNTSSDPKERSNLIVAPLALLAQWKEEIETKMAPGECKVLIHHGNSRARSVKDMQAFDVVLTTFQTLSSEWPDGEAAMRAHDNSDDELGFGKEKGPLYLMEWYRVILDEAQFIRNRRTKMSRAVAGLNALFRWCLTGTVFTNSLSDLYPLLRFLQIKPWHQWPTYNERIMKHEKRRPDMATSRCQAILRACLLRRQLDSRLDGKDLVTLPPRTTELRVLEFSTEEREIYTFVERNSQVKFNKFLRAGTVLKNYAFVLTMILRLRQLCLHPCLIQEAYDPLAAIEGGNAVANVEELDRAVMQVGEGFVRKVQKERLEQALALIAAEKRGEEFNIDSECPICMELFTEGDAEGIVTRCGHRFCRGCIREVILKDFDQDENDGGPIYGPEERPCPTCRAPISDQYIFRLSAFEPTDEVIAEINRDDDDREIDLDNTDDEAGSDDEERKPGVKTEAKLWKLSIGPDSEGEDEHKPSPSKKPKDVPLWMSEDIPSTKMLWMSNEIQRINTENPDDKILVISSFTSALNICDHHLQSLGIRTTRFQGKMNRKKRDKSLRVFKNSNSTKVMLMSLKAGGVGLNLVRGNHVISMDLAWSSAVEEQAFSRCHRIGSTKPVFVDRLTIENSVEQRIGEMQARKQALSDAALGEGDGFKLGKMTVAELAGLFGLRANGARVDD